MFSKYLKSLSILKKFLFINFIIFTIIGLFTIIYLNNIQPNLIKKKSINHTNIINNMGEEEWVGKEISFKDKYLVS